MEIDQNGKALVVVIGFIITIGPIVLFEIFKAYIAIKKWDKDRKRGAK